jgi:lysophospholipase L1-like esterase
MSSFTNQVIFLGDSIMLGNHVSAGQDLPSKVASLLPDIAANKQNLAIGSTYANEDGTHTDGGQGVTADGAWIDSVQVNVCVILFGANDIAAGFSGTTYVAALKTYCQSRKAAMVAPQKRIVICTTLPGIPITDNGFESQRLIGNLGMLADGSFWDGYANLAADPVMGLQATNSDPTYYSDGVHPTNAGNDLLAPWISRAVEVLITPASIGYRSL